MADVTEPTVQFKLWTDRSQMLIQNEETKNVLVEISGYDLQFNINFEYINSIEDVETAVGGLGEMFRHIILDKLLEYKKQSD
jgi:hypothetical protein